MGLHLSLVFLLVLQVPPDLLVPGGLVGHLFQLALSFPSDLYVHEVLFWEVLFPPQEKLSGSSGGSPPPGGPSAPFLFPESPGVLLSVMEMVSSSVSSPSSCLDSLSSPPPSSGGPPPPPGGGPLPPPEGKPNCSRHPFNNVSLPSRGLLFLPRHGRLFPLLRGFSWGPGVVSWLGILGWLFLLLFKRQNRSGVIPTTSYSG